jgi:fumarate reductase subunit D
MYLDTGTLVAICIALVSQLIMMVVLFRSAYLWEQRYHHAAHILKTERIARDIRY